MKKVIIAAGGTGGHVLPAQRLAALLKERQPELELLFVGSGLGKNRFFQKEQFAFYDIHAAPPSIQPQKFFKACFRIPVGIAQSLILLRRMKPDLIVGFGSYHIAPLLAAATLLSIPMILHEANAIPGRVNRLFSKKALWTGVFFSSAKKGLSGNVQQTAIALRKECYEPFRPTRDEGLRYFGLDHSKKTVLVFGGSQGAKRINELVAKAVTSSDKKFQIVHFVGKGAPLLSYEDAGVQAVVKEFEPNMHYAWAAADCAVVRSGASTVAEQVAFSVPALFIPYPLAQDNHQEVNARWVQDTVQGGFVLKESDATAEGIAVRLRELLKNGEAMKKRLAAMHSTLLKNDFCAAICKELGV